MAVAIEDIKDYESLRDWLTDRPVEDARLIAFRGALRSFPFIARAAPQKDFGDAILLPIIWAHTAARFAGTWPNRAAEIWDVADAAARHARVAANADRHSVTGAVAHAARAAADVVVRSNTDAAALAAARAAAHCADALTRVSLFQADTAIYTSVRDDARFLSEATGQTTPAMIPLWPNNNRPDWFNAEWEKLSQTMREMDDGWEVWNQWYQDIIDGKTADEETQLQIALIPEETWNQGAKVVNAEVARILGSRSGQDEIEQTDMAEPPDRDAPVPELPLRELTPVKFVFNGDIVDAEPASPLDVAPNRERLVHQGWAALRNLISDFQELGGGHQDRHLARILERCLQSMGASYDDLDIVALGLAQDQLNQKANRAHDEMLTGSADQLIIVNVQVKLFLQQSPDWDLYRTGLGTELGPEQEEIEALPHLSSAVQAMTNILSDAAEAKLKELQEDVTKEGTPDDPNPTPAPLPRRSYLRAGQDFLLTVFGAILSPVGEGYKDGVKKLVSAAIIGAGLYLGALATSLPSHFAWVTPVLQHITKTLGK